MRSGRRSGGLVGSPRDSSSTPRTSPAAAPSRRRTGPQKRSPLAKTTCTFPVSMRTAGPVRSTRRAERLRERMSLPYTREKAFVCPAAMSVRKSTHSQRTVPSGQ